MLVFAQEDVIRRVLFEMNYGPYIGLFPPNADRSWLDTSSFRVPFNYWHSQLTERRDVFLGYCGSSTGTAQNLKRFLEKDVGATVLDWRTDFAPGRTILEEIEEAATRCSAGVFLFTKDDKLTGDAHADTAVPRDNVIFEAGYFVNAKGKDHVLIVRQAGTKLPADLGGDIYASLEDKADIGPVEEQVLRFVARL
jgi:predicted nucleotide-binding protein